MTSRLSLGKEYSKALALAFEARGTPRYPVLAETADMLHLQFKQVQADLAKHRKDQHPRVPRLPRDCRRELGIPPHSGASAPAGGLFKGPCDNEDVASYLVEQINPASPLAGADDPYTQLT